MKVPFTIEPKKDIPFLAILLIILSSVTVFLVVLFKFSVNLPFRDDWTAILMFLNSWVDANGPLSKFNLIVENQFDHRIAWIRIVSLAVYKILGIVDIKVIILIGSMALFLVLFCLWSGDIQKDRKTREKFFWFAPVVLLLLQPMYSECWFQAMSSISSFYAIAFGIIGLFILHKTEKEPWFWVLVAFLFSLMGFFSHREGLSFLIAGIALLFFQKKWLKMSVWAVLLVLAFLFYQNYGISGLKGVYSYQFSLQRLFASILYFFSFVGNNFGINTGSGYFKTMPDLLKGILSVLPMICGMVTSGCLVWMAVKRYDRVNPFISSLVIGILIICAGAALFRDGSSDAMVSRYRIVTIFLIIAVYIAFMELIRNPEIKKWVWRGFLIFGLVFSAGAYALKIKPIRDHKNELVNSFKTYQKTGKGLIPVAWTPDNPEFILKESVKKGVWKVPERY